MIDEYFIDQTLIAGISLPINESISRDILESINFILKSYKKETPADSFPIEFLDKFSILEYITTHRLNTERYDFETLIHGMNSGKFSNFIPALRNMKIEFTKEQKEDLGKLVFKKRKISELLKGKKELLQKLSDIENGNVADDDEAIRNWETAITGLNNQIVTVKKLETQDDITFIDVLNGDYSGVMEKLRDQSEFKTSIKTGFRFLNESLPSGGFEPTRLYLIGGTSGVGKSTILINFLGNAVLNAQPYDGNKRDVLLYITAENLIDESLERLYCMMTGCPVSELKQKYKQPSFSLKPELAKLMNDKAVNITVVYVQPKKTKVSDIENLIDKVISQGNNVVGVFIDYLDLIRSGYNLIDLRHELGEVAIGFKNIAVTYRLPVITVTQLNRAGYDPKGEPSLIQMSESMQKIDNSDFVLFIQQDKEAKISIPTTSGLVKECKHIKLSILKNRNGPVNKSELMVMQEKIGYQEIFNFRIEEKCRMSNSSLTVQNNSNTTAQDLNWGTF